MDLSGLQPLSSLSVPLPSLGGGDAFRIRLAKGTLRITGASVGLDYQSFVLYKVNLLILGIFIHKLSLLCRSAFFIYV